jgi:hypothetical protein
MKKQDLKVGGQYHFLGDNKISLLYIGKEFMEGRFWYQFSQVSAPMAIWAELCEQDLDIIEEL